MRLEVRTFYASVPLTLDLIQATVTLATTSA